MLLTFLAIASAFNLTCTYPSGWSTEVTRDHVSMTTTFVNGTQSYDDSNSWAFKMRLRSTNGPIVQFNDYLTFTFGEYSYVNPGTGSSQPQYQLGCLFETHYEEKVNLNVYAIVYDEEDNLLYQLNNCSLLYTQSQYLLKYSDNLANAISNDFAVYIKVTFTYLDEDVYNAVINSSDDNAYSNGYEDGYNSGYNVGFTSGESTGYNSGYADARDLYESTNAAANSIFSGILNIALIPVNFFLAILNFEVFGINIGGFVSGLLSVAVVVYIIRIIMGNSSSGGGGTSNG